jgi:hypothetical protein
LILHGSQYLVTGLLGPTDLRRSLVPLVAVKGTDGVGRRPDDHPATGQGEFPGTESVIELGADLVEEGQIERRLFRRRTL